MKKFKCRCSKSENNAKNGCGYNIKKKKKHDFAVTARTSNIVFKI